MYILDRYPDAKQSFYSRINNAEEAGRNEQKQLEAQMAQAPASQAPDVRVVSNLRAYFLFRRFRNGKKCIIDSPGNHSDPEVQ